MARMEMDYKYVVTLFCESLSNNFLLPFLLRAPKIRRENQNLWNTKRKRFQNQTENGLVKFIWAPFSLLIIVKRELEHQVPYLAIFVESLGEFPILIIQSEESARSPE